MKKSNRDNTKMSKFCIWMFLSLTLSTLVKGQDLPGIIFTQPPDWTISMPTTARQDHPTNPRSYSFDPLFIQTFGGRERTVASVVGGEGEDGNPFDLSGVHLPDDNAVTENGILDRDIFFDLRGGYFDKISAGPHVDWNRPYVNVQGNELTQLAGNVRVNWVFGAGDQGGHSAILTGNAGVVVKDSAVVLGSIIGGWRTQHNQTPTISGNTDVLIFNVQGETAQIEGNVNGVPVGMIIGGSAWGWNTSSSSVVEGNSSVQVLIDPELVQTPTNFVKTIVGGSASPNSTLWNGGGNEQVLGNSSVSITAPTNVHFTAPIYAGGLFYPDIGLGAVQTKGQATLTLNGGTFSSLLDAGAADQTKTIIFNGINVLAEGASVHGFDEMTFNTSSVIRVTGNTVLEAANLSNIGEGSEVQIGRDAKLSLIVSPDTPIPLPIISQLEGNVSVTLYATRQQAHPEAVFSIARITEALLPTALKKFSGNVLDPENGTVISSAKIFLDGTTVKLQPINALVWFEKSGTWTSTSFNNEQDNYQDGTSSVCFADSVHSVPLNHIEIQGEKHVTGMRFENSDITSYQLDGDSVYTPSLVTKNGGNVIISGPLHFTSNGMIQIGTMADVTLGNIFGEIGNLKILDNPNNAYGGNITLDFSTNPCLLNGPIYIGLGRTLTLASSAKERKIPKIQGYPGGASILFNPSTTDAHLICTNDLAVATIKNMGPGKVTLAHDMSLNYILEVHKGEMVINGSISHCTANLAHPIRVFPDATIRFEGYQCYNRMPENAWLFSNKGQVEIYGVNPFPGFPLSPNLILTNQATLVADCSLSGTHIKLTNVMLDNSDIIISGEQSCYDQEGLVCSNITVNGTCSFRYAEGATRNKIRIYDSQSSPVIPAELVGGIDVSEGSILHVGTAMKSFAKKGFGTLIAEKGSSFDNLDLQQGTLAIPSESGTFASVNIREKGKIDLTAPHSILNVTGEFTVNHETAVSVEVTGRAFTAEEKDPALGGIPLIRWETMPLGNFKLLGLPENLKFVKTDSAGLIQTDGTIIFLL